MKQAFVDLDGVLANFIEPAMAAHGVKYDRATYPAGEWHIPTVLGISDTEFWKVLEGPEFWANLEPYPWMVSLIGGLRDLGYVVTIATSPSLDPQCPAGKTQWFYKHLGDGKSRPRFRDYFIGSEKYRLARPGDVLIDDNESTVDKFSSHRGWGLLFPQHWNSGGHREHPARDVLDILRAHRND